MMKNHWFDVRGSRQPATERERRHLARVEQLEARWVMAAPTLGAISNVTLVAGAPLNLALDGFDADGDPLQFSASVTNNVGNVSTLIPQGNHSLRMNVVQKNAGGTVLQDFGTMEFQLFNDLTPNTTARIEQLVNQGFYNNLTFHRVINNFMIQGGDPLGTGTGGSGTSFNDEFDTSLRFTSSGILAMAKSSDDTNDSQFFITDAPTRWLDFQHSIFGFLTKGESVRDTINSVPVGANDRPLNSVVITSATIFSDVENGVLRLSAPIGAVGTSTVTVTVNDGHGGTATRTLNVTVVADSPTNNGNPFLRQPSDMNALVGQSVSQTLTAVDAEGDAIGFWGYQPVSGIDWNYGLNASNQLVKYRQVTTTNGLATATFTVITSTPGKKTQRILVLPATANGSDDSVFDTQDIKINVSPNAPTAIDLLAASDTGENNSDNITALDNSSGAKKLSFQVSGVWQGSTVTLKIGSRVIGTATVPPAAAGALPALTDVNITTNGIEALSAGVNSIVAIQSVDGLQSTLSTSLRVVVDNRIFGDANGNGIVDGADYIVWADNFLKPNRLGPQQGDFNWNGVVDATDYVLWADHFTPSAVPAAVPNAEPVAASVTTIQPVLAAPAPTSDAAAAPASAATDSRAVYSESARAAGARLALTSLVDDLFERFGKDDVDWLKRLRGINRRL